MNPLGHRITHPLPRAVHLQSHLPSPKGFQTILKNASNAYVSSEPTQSLQNPIRPLSPSRREEPPSPNRDPEPEEIPPLPLLPLLFDPLQRNLLDLRPPAPPPLSPPSVQIPPVNQLVDRLLRRVALGGSRHRGTAFLEIGTGKLQGTTIEIHAEEGLLHIEVDAPDEEASRQWKHQLEKRLQHQGLKAEILLR